MRFITWLNETINVPPHLPEKWLADSLRKAKLLENKMSGLGNIVKEADRVGKEYEHGWDAAGYLWRHLPWALRKMVEQLSSKEKEYGYDPISARIEEYKRVSEIQNITLYLIKHARNNISLYERWENVADFMKQYSETVLKEKEFDKLIDKIDDDIGHIKTIELVREKFQAVKEYIVFARGLSRELAALKEREDIISSRYDRDGQKYPAHGKTETLYHATPFVREIMSQGFKTKEQVGREVLGGATKGISFTADKRIAQEIARSLVDVIRIARGELRLKDVIMMAKREGIPIKGSQWAKDQVYLGLKKRRGTVDPMWDSNERQVFELYRHYLMHTKIRYNPLFFGVRIEQFADLDPNNVGVLAAKVDMGQVLEYLPSMEEFRVPVNAILNYRKI